MNFIRWQGLSVSLVSTYSTQVNCLLISLLFVILFVFPKVVSQSVANALLKVKGPSAAATRKFVQMFDKFFDYLNVRSTREGFMKRKDSVLPYERIDDARLQVSVCFTDFALHGSITLNLKVKYPHSFHSSCF